MRTITPSRRAKTVLMIVPTPPPHGGGEIMCEMLVREMRRDDDYDIIHINTGDGRGIASRGKLDLISVGTVLRNLVYLIKDILIYRPDIVYLIIAQRFRSFLRDWFYIICSSLLGVRVICHLHGGYFEANNGNKLKKAFVNTALKRISTLLVHGNNIRQRLKQQLPIQNFVVVHNGINPNLQRKSDDKKQNGKFHVLFMGALREYKGIFDILKAIPLVLRKTDEIEFWFAGEWPSNQIKERVLELIKQNGVEDHVRFWGLILGGEKNEFFSQGDVLLHPTYYDGQPIVILEAMSVGLPIISTDVGSIAETIEHDKNGFIIPTGRPDKIAEKILLLYRDERLRKAMSGMSKKIYETRYTEEVFLENMKQAFNQAINGETNS